MIMAIKKPEEEKLEERIKGILVIDVNQREFVNKQNEMEYVRNGKYYALGGALVAGAFGALMTYAGIESESAMLSGACYLAAGTSFVASAGLGVLGFIKNKELKRGEQYIQTPEIPKKLVEEIKKMLEYEKQGK